MIEKIIFDDETYIWKTKLDFLHKKDLIMSQVKNIIESKPQVKMDNYGYKQEFQSLSFDGILNIENDLDKIINKGIELCKSLYFDSYNKINMDSWVNIVRSVEPKQINFKYIENSKIDKYHVHVDIQKNMNMFYPNFTWVYYIQMPDVMENEDGVLYIKGKNEKEYYIKPEEDDLIIMYGWLPHSPNNAPKAKTDRIVMAGNVGFEFIKKEKSFI